MFGYGPGNGLHERIGRLHLPGHKYQFAAFRLDQPLGGQLPLQAVVRNAEDILGKQVRFPYTHHCIVSGVFVFEKDGKNPRHKNGGQPGLVF